jgi:hypothetical protein
LVGGNDCKCSRDQRLNVPSEAQKQARIYQLESENLCSKLKSSSVADKLYKYS